MSLFQCENCGCVENTALCFQGCKRISDSFDWTGIEDRKGKMLCSACAPIKFSDGDKTELGVWHGEFNRTFLPMGEFKTARNGNLEHIKTGSTNYRDFAIPGEPGESTIDRQSLSAIKAQAIKEAADWFANSEGAYGVASTLKQYANRIRQQAKEEQ